MINQTLIRILVIGIIGITFVIAEDIFPKKHDPRELPISKVLGLAENGDNQGTMKGFLNAF